MNSKKRFGAAVALAAVAALAFATSAQAVDCGTPAVYETVKIAAVPPTYGPDVKVVDVPGSPAVEEVSHTERKLVTEAVAGQHYSLKGNSGIGKDETPVFPAEYWQANTEQEPHDNGAGSPVTWLDQVGSGLHYASHGSEGLRDWFYFKPGTDAVYEDVKVVDVEAKDAVEEVSHIEKGAILTPGTPASEKQVLVKAAVTKECASKTADPKDPKDPAAPVPTLAYTGSQTQDLAALGGLVLLLGFGAIRAARRLT